MSFISSPRGFSSYRDVDTNSRVAGASAHELVNILFDEVLLRLEQTIRHAERDDIAAMLQARARASNILSGLSESLDFEKGGDLAIALNKIYVEAGKRINAASHPSKIGDLVSAREMLAEIAGAWKAIAPK